MPPAVAAMMTMAATMIIQIGKRLFLVTMLVFLFSLSIYLAPINKICYTGYIRYSANDRNTVIGVNLNIGITIAHIKGCQLIEAAVQSFQFSVLAHIKACQRIA